MAKRLVTVGELRHRLVIQSARAADDGGGGQSDPWSDPVTVATVWGKVEPLTGGERPRAMQIEDRLSHRVVIRHRPGITPAMRIVFGTRLFNVRAVVNREERGRFLELLCEEGAAA